MKKRKCFVNYSPDVFIVLVNITNCYLWCLAARSKSVIPGEGAPNQGSPRSSRSMERPLKAGWLKKQQRSLVKNWQQRYFVLRGSTLTYHKDDKETTVQVRHPNFCWFWLLLYFYFIYIFYSFFIVCFHWSHVHIILNAICTNITYNAN